MERDPERVLTEALERLPQYAAPLALKRRLAAEWPADATFRRRGRPPFRMVSALAALAAVLVLLPLGWSRYEAMRDRRVASILVTEAARDHVAVLTRGLDVESSGVHQVKPWFQGRLDFAPTVAFAGDAEYPLLGGSTVDFLGGRAAVYVYGRRLHRVSLVVFPADRVRWPAHGEERLGPLEARRGTSRGFNVILWRAGDLGYALVSDIDMAELAAAARRFAAS